MPLCVAISLIGQRRAASGSPAETVCQLLSTAAASAVWIIDLVMAAMIEPSVAPHNPLSMGVGAAAPAAGHALDAVQPALQARAADLVSAFLELRNERFVGGARLDLRRPVAAAEVRRIDGALDVELPVEHADQRLRHVVDDGGAAR